MSCPVHFFGHNKKNEGNIVIDICVMDYVKKTEKKKKNIIIISIGPFSGPGYHVLDVCALEFSLNSSN